MTLLTISLDKLQHIIEAALMVAGHPLPISHLQRLFEENERPATAEIQAALNAIAECYQERGICLKEVASGYQFQAKAELSPWLCKLWDERPPRYSRALLETLALIAYRQPITRAEIEEIRGVAVSSNIIKTLVEREWIKVIGYREVVGKPALYGTTKAFLDHFNLKTLDELPTLAELKDLESQEAKLQVQLELPEPESLDMINHSEESITREIGSTQHDADLAATENSSVIEDNPHDSAKLNDVDSEEVHLEESIEVKHD